MRSLFLVPTRAVAGRLGAGMGIVLFRTLARVIAPPNEQTTRARSLGVFRAAATRARVGLKRLSFFAATGFDSADKKTDRNPVPIINAAVILADIATGTQWLHITNRVSAAFAHRVNVVKLQLLKRELPFAPQASRAKTSHQRCPFLKRRGDSEGIPHKTSAPPISACAEIICFDLPAAVPTVTFLTNSLLPVELIIVLPYPAPTTVYAVGKYHRPSGKHFPVFLAKVKRLIRVRHIKLSCCLHSPSPLFCEGRGRGQSPTGRFCTSGKSMDAPAVEGTTCARILCTLGLKLHLHSLPSDLTSLFYLAVYRKEKTYLRPLTSLITLQYT